MCRVLFSESVTPGKNWHVRMAEAAAFVYDEAGSMLWDLLVFRL
jgi:hypothetical protein